MLAGKRTLLGEESTQTFWVWNSFFQVFEQLLEDSSYSPQPQLNLLTSYRTTTPFGFIRLTLQGPTRSDTNTNFEAFGHQLFPTRYATQAIALSRQAIESTDPAPELPNEPITPTLASLSLDYSASVEIVPGDRQSPDLFFNLEPFGYALAEQTNARLVPALEDRVFTNTTNDFHLGAVYIGLTNFTPPGNISLLFQIERGTATADTILDENDTEWSYLSGNTWTVLPRTAILNDSTFGFQEPGTVVLSLGRDASVEHTLMPPGQIWLRALIHQPATSAARTTALSSQAVTATFTPTIGSISDYNTHLQFGLTTKTIQRLKRRLAAIKTVQQPLPSFGGRASETDTDFFRRCSERLRHRHRAVTTWDFERLTLKAFPEIFQGEMFTP